MDGVEIVARGIGAFYTLGGAFGLRAIAGDAVMDKALSALTLTPPDSDSLVRRRLMAVLVSVTGLSGIALLLMSGWAAPLFLFGLALQAAWLVWTGRTAAAEDEDDGVGRLRSIHAAALWIAATALVLWLRWHERLGPLLEPVAPAAMAFAAGAGAIWAAPHLLWRPEPAPPSYEPPPREPDPRPERLVLRLRYGYLPLWDADRAQALNPSDWLPGALCERIMAWETTFYDAVAADRWEDGPAFTRDQAAAHAAEGRAIVASIEEIFGAGTVRGPLYGDDEASTPIAK